MGTRIALILGILALLSATAQAATFTVTKQQDTNDHACTASNCSLRDAIIASNTAAGPNVIHLRAGDYKLTISGTGEDAAATGDLDITKSVTIDGAGVSTTTIDGNHIDRVFELLSAANLTVSGVEVTGGLADATGAGSIDAGGAVLDAAGGSVAFTNAAIDDNTASGTNAKGGGIDALSTSTGTVTLTNTTATGDRAGGSSPTDVGYGAVIEADEPGALTLTHVTMTGNHAGGNGAGGYGGAVESEGGPVTVSSSTFTGNTAGGAGGFGYGGALNAFSATITGSTFQGNHAGGGGGASGFGYGGAIFFGTTVSLTRTTVTGNSAGGGGGGAFGYGGGVEGMNGTVTMTGSNVSDNVAGGGSKDAFGYGGGIDAPVTATDSTISGNTAGGGDGYGKGGGINGAGFSPTTTLTNTTLSGNRAGGGGPDGAGYGGGIEQGVGTLTVTFSDVVGNSASAVPVTPPTMPPTFTGGGGGTDGPATIKDSIVADNTSASHANCFTAVTSRGHNIENGTTCGFAMTGDLNAEPHLGPLAGNGGPTPTRMPLSGSAAINHGDSTGCPATDQRGVARPQGIACDIGAYELAPPTAVTGGFKIGTRGHVNLSGTGTNPDVTAGTVFFQVGRTAAYGSQSSSLPLEPGSDQFNLSTGKLAPGTLYHYRAETHDVDGTTVGVDRTFRTPKAPAVSHIAIHGHKIAYTDTESGVTKFTLLAGHKTIAHFSHTGRAGRNHLRFEQHLEPGKYVLEAKAQNSFGTFSKVVTKHFKVT